MGYTIIIGEQIFDDTDPEIQHYTIEIIEDVNAPIFKGDNPTYNTNVRKPKYSDWEYFLNKVDLYDLFLGDEGLMKQHPGIAQITEMHYNRINQAYHITFAFTDKIPGWDQNSNWDESKYGTHPLNKDTNIYDYDLARLSWLRFWFRWALDNCSNPSIYNS